MQVYREKRKACAALKQGEKTLRVETSAGSVYKNLTDTEAIEEMKRATLHEVGNTNKMKLWFDFDKMSDAKDDHEDEERRLCWQMAKLAFVAYAAAGGWAAECLLNLSETVLEKVLNRRKSMCVTNASAKTVNPFRCQKSMSTPAAGMSCTKARRQGKLRSTPWRRGTDALRVQGCVQLRLLARCISCS